MLRKVGATARVESFGDEESLGEDASKQGRINDIDADDDITLVSVQDDADKEMFDVDALNGHLNITTISSQQSQDKGKGIMIEEPVKPMKKKDLTRIDEEVALKLQVKIEADHELAQRLQAEEQEELSVEEKAKLFQQLLEQRRKHFAAKRKKLKDLKNKYFDSIQKMFDRAFKRMNTFVNFRTDLVEDEEEVAIDVVPLATKPPTIVDWKIHKEGKNSYIQIIRADGSSKMYLVFSQLLKSVNKEDLVELYKLVKAKYGSTRPVKDMNMLLWGDLKTMFKPHVEDEIWKLQQRYKVLSWKLFDSCGVHCLSLQYKMIYMLVEKRYPLTPPIIIDMLNKKLQGRIVGIKSLLNAASITAAHIRVNAAQLC
ncbi:hypothetical protein Tco_0121133 [Tanacetum coccineum]